MKKFNGKLWWASPGVQTVRGMALERALLNGEPGYKKELFLRTRNINPGIAKVWQNEGSWRSVFTDPKERYCAAKQAYRLSGIEREVTLLGCRNNDIARSSRVLKVSQELGGLKHCLLISDRRKRTMVETSSYMNIRPQRNEDEAWRAVTTRHRLYSHIGELKAVQRLLAFQVVCNVAQYRGYITVALRDFDMGRQYRVSIYSSWDNLCITYKVFEDLSEAWAMYYKIARAGFEKDSNYGAILIHADQLFQQKIVRTA